MLQRCIAMMSVCVLAVSLHGMDVSRVNKNKIQKTFTEENSSEENDNYFYDSDKTKNLDDTILSFFIEKELFKELFVQAFCDERSSIEGPFFELVKKMQEQKLPLVSIDREQCFAMTSKDARHRLLSYIPATKNFKICEVNNLEMELKLKIARASMAYPHKKLLFGDQLMVKNFPLNPIPKRKHIEKTYHEIITKNN